MPQKRQTITACILAWNEARRLEDAIKSLQGWVDQIIVIDNESDDDTVLIAKKYTSFVLSAPRSANYDALRELALEHATGDWFFVLDADERVQPTVVPIIQQLIEEKGDQFSALTIPFKNYFCGKWMEHSCWWPGYSRPQLLKKGKFRYGVKLHSGVTVDGESINLPPNPNVAIDHYSYDSVSHYIEKLNRYTDGEAENLLSEDASHSWQTALAAFIGDWRTYYEGGRAHLDGMHGFVLAFLSGHYRLLSRLKLWDLRRRSGQTASDEPVPTSLREMLEFMAAVSQEGTQPWLGSHVPHNSSTVSLGRDKRSESALRSTQRGSRTITVCVTNRMGSAQKDSARVEAVVGPLREWADQIIVMDAGSSSPRPETAHQNTEIHLSIPWGAYRSDIQRIAEDAAVGEWILFLAEGDRVSPSLGAAIDELIAREENDFDAIRLPVRNIHYGKWMQSGAWWPGYEEPQLVRNTRQNGIESDADATADAPTPISAARRIVTLPADDPDVAIVRDAYTDIASFISVLNRETDVEAGAIANPVNGARVTPPSWESMLAGFALDLHDHYDRHQAWRDGMHGFIQSLLSALSRFVAAAKVWDLHQQAGRTQDNVSRKANLPTSLREMLTFMAKVVQDAETQVCAAPPAPILPRQDLVPTLWRGPVFDATGYADDGRNLILSLMGAGEPISILQDVWSEVEVALPAADQDLLNANLVRRISPAEIYIYNTLPRLLEPNADAAFNIARTVFETDRLPAGWADKLNQWDRVWVPSEFNREGFVRSGVDPAKIAVIPEALDTQLFASPALPWDLPGNEEYKFLSVFEWSLHKGWDVLIESFARAHGSNALVGLYIKTWSSLTYSLDDIISQADTHLRTKLGVGLEAFPNIHIWSEMISAGDMPRLYRAADCFVIATRCDGWCRPLMEAMAVGLPTIATAWSGLTAFHNAEVGYELKYVQCQVSEEGALELPIYRGHEWAEPDGKDLQMLLKRVVRNRSAAQKKGAAAQGHIASNFSRAVVGAIVQNELKECRNVARQRIAVNPPAAPRSAATYAPKRRAILIQSASGAHARMLELTQARHRAYAANYRFDFVCRTAAQQSERHPAWDKILLILQALRKNEWDYIVWLDADTLIVDIERDLRDALPGEAWLGMVAHHDPSWFNSGAIYIRNTPQSLAFFEEVWRTHPAEHFWEDNMAIIRVLGFNPTRWSGVVVIDDVWNSTRLMNEVAFPVVKAWHGTGDVHTSIRLLEQELAVVEHRALSNPKAGADTELFMPRANKLQLAPPPSVDFNALLGRKLRIRWEGPQNVLSSLALVNRELCMGLIEAGDVELQIDISAPNPSTLPESADSRFEGLFKLGSTKLSGPPDITIRHHYPPNWARPAAGRLAVMQPWETSHLPETSWIEGASAYADQIWANSRFVRDAYARSGVPAERVLLVPEGARSEVFTPSGPRFPLSRKARTQFLFVGGTIHRKGPDILLQAYLRAFKPTDDVSLIVKDMGTQTFYRGQNLGETFRRIQGDVRAPRIIYLDDDLSETQLASLYREATCLVLPYRGEGFGLPPLEAMACGTLPIVTAGGATDDYVDDAMALRLPYRRRPIPLRTTPGALPVESWEMEPDVQALVSAMRWVYDNDENASHRGKAAASYVAENWTWARSAAVIRDHMAALVAPKAVSATPEAIEVKASKGPKPRSRSAAAAKVSRIQISLCMIVRDEGPHLGECLKGIKPYVDEMVVVDTGSIDNTCEVALKCGARVYKMDWPDSFAEARNRSIELAKGEWIFWMDADDIISPECGAKLRDLVNAHPKRDAAYQISVHIPPGPGEHGPSLVDHVKLFPNRPELRFEHRIHEQIIPSLRRAGIDVRFSDLYVTHQHYDRSEAGQAKKRLRDFRLLHLDLLDHPDHPFTLFNLGMTYLYATREFEVAAQYLMRSLRGSDWRDSIVRKIYALLTSARMCQQDWPLALRANEEGRSYYPDDAELLFQAGEIYQRLNRTEEARLALEQLINGDDSRHYRSVTLGLRTYRGRHELALLAERTGDIARAKLILTALTHDHPDYEPAQTDLNRLSPHS